MRCHAQHCPGCLWKSRQWHPAAGGSGPYLRTQGRCGFYSALPSLCRGSGRVLSASKAMRKPPRKPWWPDCCPRRDRVLQLPCPQAGRRMGVIPGGLLRLLKSCWRVSFPRASRRTWRLRSRAVFALRTSAGVLALVLQPPSCASGKLTWHFVGVTSFVPHLNPLGVGAVPLLQFDKGEIRISCVMFFQKLLNPGLAGSYHLLFVV